TQGCKLRQRLVAGHKREFPGIEEQNARVRVAVGNVCGTLLFRLLCRCGCDRGGWSGYRRCHGCRRGGCRSGDADQRRFLRLLRARTHSEKQPEKCEAYDDCPLLLARPGRKHCPGDCVGAGCLVRRLLVVGFPNRGHFVASSAGGAVGRKKGRRRANQECADLARLSATLSGASVTGQTRCVRTDTCRLECRSRNPTHRQERDEWGTHGPARMPLWRSLLRGIADVWRHRQPGYYT